jgi:Transcriptional regulator
VGRRVEALEEALGFPVFHETPHGPEPTARGALVLQTAARIESEIDSMLAEMNPAAERNDFIRIAGSGGIVSEFAPELLAFRKEMPGVSIELLSELDPIDAVTHRRADLGIAIVRTPPRRLAAVKIATISQARYGLCGSQQKCQLGWGHEVDATLPGQWITSNPSGVEAEAMELMTFNSWPQLKHAVLAGFGTAKLWCFAADSEAMLERLDEPDPRDDYPLWLIRRAKVPPAPALNDLIRFLEQRLGTRLREPTPTRESNE